jgi:peroxiredoxin Q/BCP
MKNLPAFRLSLIDGSILKSPSIKKKTILFFYTKAMTSGCVTEVQEFQNFLLKFKKMGFIIIGCSKDSIKKNIKFAEKYKVKYLLTSDLNNACENQTYG